MTDIHNHLLPGVDDGAQSLDESVRHLQALRAEGVADLSVSPHLFGWLINEADALAQRLDALEAAFDELVQAVAERTDVPQLYFGQEILCQTPEIAKRVFQVSRAGYRGTRYALVEFGFDLQVDATPIVRAVLDAGRRIIISHPERYRRHRSSLHLEEVAEWKAAGALLQVNAGSLFGDYGPGPEQLAWQLLESGMADLIATDHHADYRVVSARAAFEAIRERGTEDLARRLLAENTARVLADQDLLPVPLLHTR